MSIKLGDNIEVQIPKPLDSKYLNDTIPYTGVAQVNTCIASGLRNVGLTVNINNDEYWYRCGILNTDLVIKLGGGSAITGATNGLTISNNKIALGGTLTGATTIDITTFPLMISGITGSFKVCPGGNIDLYGVSGCLRTEYGGGGIKTLLSNKAGNILLEQCNTGVCSATLDISTLTGTVFTDTTTNTQGILYGGDYEVDFVARSLVTKQYVTGYTASVANIVNVCNVTGIYSATTTSGFIGVSGASCIYLMNSPNCGQKVSVADICGCALISPITINGNGRRINDGICTCSLINTNYGSITFIYNGYFWSAVAFTN